MFFFYIKHNWDLLIVEESRSESRSCFMTTLFAQDLWWMLDTSWYIYSLVSIGRWNYKPTNHKWEDPLGARTRSNGLKTGKRWFPTKVDWYPHLFQYIPIDMFQLYGIFKWFYMVYYPIIPYSTIIPIVAGIYMARYISGYVWLIIVTICHYLKQVHLKNKSSWLPPRYCNLVYITFFELYDYDIL